MQLNICEYLIILSFFSFFLGGGGKEGGRRGFDTQKETVEDEVLI